MCKKYDYLIVGSGLFGSVFAHEATLRGKKCLVLERRDHVGGNIYCEEIEGVTVHRYGAHIFHTANRRVWKYVNDLAEFNRFTNSPIANYKGEIYNMPFNMNTFSKLWGVVTPDEAREKIEAQRGVVTGEPKNLEEQAIRLVGTDIYAKLIKGYTEKQWGRPCTELPAFIIKRLPVRYTYDNNYFNDPYQGIPVNGYNEIIDKVTHEDFKNFGLIPEFLGRLPIICPLKELTEDEMCRILTEPKNALIKQYQALMEYDNIELDFDKQAIRAIAKKALDNKTGARGLRSIMEDVLLDVMYTAPDKVKAANHKCTLKITEKCITDNVKPELVVKKNRGGNPLNDAKFVF